VRGAVTYCSAKRTTYVVRACFFSRSSPSPAVAEAAHRRLCSHRSAASSQRSTMRCTTCPVPVSPGPRTGNSAGPPTPARTDYELQPLTGEGISKKLRRQREVCYRVQGRRGRERQGAGPPQPRGATLPPARPTRLSSPRRPPQQPRQHMVPARLRWERRDRTPGPSPSPINHSQERLRLRWRGKGNGNSGRHWNVSCWISPPSPSPYET